jgi:UDP-glucose 4-epimerase
MSPGYTLVTGGAGFIGSHLVERLLADGESVMVIDDFSTGSRDNFKGVAGSNRLEVINSKISSCAELPKLAGGCKCIYHLAAAVGVELVVKAPARVLETNLRETEIIVETASAQGIPLLFTSTSEVYGKSAKESFSEEDDLIIGPPRFARWGYACSKLMDEFMVQAFARERVPWRAVIARLFNTVGPRQVGRYGMVLPRFIAAAKAGEPLRVFGDGGQTRCFCDVNDTVEALVRLQNWQLAAPLKSSAVVGEAETFNVGGTDEISIFGLAKLVIEILDSRSRIELVPYTEAYAPGFEDMARRKPAVEKLERITGFRPKTALREIIAEIARDE